MEALAMGVVGATGAAFASPYVFGRFSNPTEVRAAVPYAVDSVSRSASMLQHSSLPPLQQSAVAHELDDGGMDGDARSQRDCLQNILHDNSAEGRPDNHTLTSTVYKPEQYRMDMFKMPGDDMLNWGVVPQGGGRSGGFRPEWNSPQILRPNKREITQEEMYPPEGDANRQWHEAEQRGMEWARDNAYHSLSNKYNAAYGALDDYTPFDFDPSQGVRGQAGKVGLPQGTAGGRYWTQRSGATVQGVGVGSRGFSDGTRINYAGDMKKGLVQYSLRPVATNGNTIGGPVVKAQQYRQKGKWSERFSVAEWTRAPVPQTAVGVRQQVPIGNVVMRHTNRTRPLGKNCSSSEVGASCPNSSNQQMWSQGDLIAGKARLTADYYSQ